jgi:acetylornithine deacetylase/succinyl-diaminopimelate desuccinylase-like protein
VNVIVLAEGEEEVGSEHLAPFVREHARRLSCDAVVISGPNMGGKTVVLKPSASFAC